MEPTVGERIKKILFDHKISGTELADKVGMTKQTINQLINGHMKISYNFVHGIAISFPDVDLRWLIIGERTEGYLKVEEVSPEYYNPLKAKDKQIEELLSQIKRQQATIENMQESIKEILSKIPKAD